MMSLWFFTNSLGHSEETSKILDICDFLKVSDIENEWWSMEN